jgi:hydroxymethylpyrimidine pyrophosphatase-like HAD family hydrolase
LAYRILACDYDETLATDGALRPVIVEALAAARAAGWRLALVTGRPHEQLTEVCPHLALFDLVIDENGCVLHLPADGTVEELAPRPDGRLCAELARLGVPHHTGRIVVLTRQPHQREVREILDRLGLAMDVYCNRYAVMVVPRGMSKATGLRAGLARLGIAPSETIAAGDDENDLTLFSAAGLRVAVANAIDTVKAAADIVLPGECGEGVAEFIRDRMIAAPESLPAPRR